MTDVLKQLIVGGEPIDVVYAIGPVVMMRAVSHLTLDYEIHTIVSLNPIMADGTGMCGACRVTVDGQTNFACVDGPEFDGHKVDFVGLMKRQQMHLGQEKEAMERLTGLRIGDCGLVEGSPVTSHSKRGNRPIISQREVWIWSREVSSLKVLEGSSSLL